MLAEKDWWGGGSHSSPAALGFCGEVVAEGWGRGEQAGWQPNLILELTESLQLPQKAKGRQTASPAPPPQRRQKSAGMAQQTNPMLNAGDPS